MEDPLKSFHDFLNRCNLDRFKDPNYKPPEPDYGKNPEEMTEEERSDFWFDAKARLEETLGEGFFNHEKIGPKMSENDSGEPLGYPGYFDAHGNYVDPDDEYDEFPEGEI